MISVECKSLFKGNASVGSHIVERAKSNNDSICISHDGSKMIVDNFEKFFEMGGRQYPHKSGSGFYTLKYIKFEED